MLLLHVLLLPVLAAHACLNVGDEEELLRVSASSMEPTNSSTLCLQGPLDKIWVLADYPELTPVLIPTNHRLSIDCGGRGLWVYAESKGGAFFVSEWAEVAFTNCAISIFKTMEELLMSNTYANQTFTFANFGNQQGSVVTMYNGVFMASKPLKKGFVDPEVREESYVRSDRSWPLVLSAAIEEDAYWAITIIRGRYHPGSLNLKSYNLTNTTMWGGPEWSNAPSIATRSWSSPDVLSAINKEVAKSGGTGGEAEDSLALLQADSRRDETGRVVKIAILCICVFAAVALVCAVASIILLQHHRRQRASLRSIVEVPTSRGLVKTSTSGEDSLPPIAQTHAAKLTGSLGTKRSSLTPSSATSPRLVAAPCIGFDDKQRASRAAAGAWTVAASEIGSNDARRYRDDRRYEHLL